MMRNVVCSSLLITLTFTLATETLAAEPGWSPVIVATGEYRKQIQSTPIEARPYRPLHVYGNTVRRMHYRGNPLPIPKGLTQAGDLDRPRVDARPVR